MVRHVVKMSSGGKAGRESGTDRSVNMNDVVVYCVQGRLAFQLWRLPFLVFIFYAWFRGWNICNLVIILVEKRQSHEFFQVCSIIWYDQLKTRFFTKYLLSTQEIQLLRAGNFEHFHLLQVENILIINKLSNLHHIFNVLLQRKYTYLFINIIDGGQARRMYLYKYNSQAKIMIISH